MAELSTSTIATITVVAQTIAYACLILSVHFARKKNFPTHGKFSAFAFAINLVTVLLVMIPSILNLSRVQNDTFTTAALHGFVGLSALTMAALLLVKSCGWVGKFVNLKNYMRALFVLWSIAYFGGLVMYISIYQPFG